MSDSKRSTPATETAPQEKVRRTSTERARLPLVWKLFSLTALLIAAVVGIAILVTITRANYIARETVNSSISRAARLYRQLEKQRLGNLALSAQLLGNDPSFAPYVEANTAQAAPAAAPDGGAPATTPPAAAPGVPPATTTTTTATETAAPTETAPVVATGTAPLVPADAAPQESATDLVSLSDQLEQRRQALSSDLLMLLDDQGVVLVRTDRQILANRSDVDLYESTPLVKRIVDDASLPSTSGVLRLDDRLYHAAVAPVGLGTPRKIIGYLINAYAIDETFANQIAESTQAGVMFAPAMKGASGATGARSTNAPSVGMGQLAGASEILRTGKMLAPAKVAIDGSAYVMTGEPLVAGGNIAGAAVFVRSLDHELAPFKEIEKTLLAGGAIALLLAFILSWLIARRLTRPIEELAGMAQAVTAGDYDVHPRIERSDEVGILSRAFSQMIASLRDKAELEELYAAMASREQEREVAPRIDAPVRDEGTFLVTEIRGVAENATGEADALVAGLTKLMRVQEAEVKRQDGEVCEISVHRFVAIFHGERGVIKAIRAARAINEEIASIPEFGTRVGIGIGIATGTYVTGSIAVGKDGGRALVGSAPLLALIFASHAPNGHAFLSPESAQRAGTDVGSALVRQEVRLTWLPQAIAAAALPLVSVTTGMMRAVGTTTTAGETMRIGDDGAAVASLAGGELSTGALFANRYQIDQILGRGGMGVVYRATDTQLDEVVAIKTLPGDVMHRSPEDLERFKREIRLARKITHRNVLRTYDYGEAEGLYFISMEYVRGYTLSEMLEEASGHVLAPRLAVNVSRQISRGLDAAHEQGIIHRDIKPQNVLIDAKGEIKLMDFGIARMAEAPEAMTQAGLIIGTPHYMSPEQVQGKALDPRSDVYSMGVLMYEMVTGNRPFESSSLTGILAAHITEAPKPPIDVRPEIGRDLNTIILRCLAKDVRERYKDAGELLVALEAVRIPAAVAAA